MNMTENNIQWGAGLSPRATRIVEQLRRRYAEKKPVRVLFVCLGNICRSPAAEG